eukprot:evm.model.scf_18.13 EVM.evm.TU.scf_18.13   scf_18:83997-84815(+)
MESAQFVTRMSGHAHSCASAMSATMGHMRVAVSSAEALVFQTRTTARNAPCKRRIGTAARKS